MKSRLLGQFQAPEIQEWLTRNPHFLAEPVSQNAAIIFIDLSGFTSLSEEFGPHRVQELLRDFHALVDHEVDLKPRNPHQLSGRWRDDPVRPAGGGAG